MWDNVSDIVSAVVASNYWEFAGVVFADVVPTDVVSYYPKILELNRGLVIY